MRKRKDKSMKNIIEIEIEKIKAHPNNPRRDLGDLTELSESIRQNGIMQNLTVVKNDDETFTAVIGHRRLAAAREAGLSVVPCVVSDMDEKKQLSVMLLENMQRSDLTPIEQAEGFQMMMDLGATASEVSEQTGFSKTTISHRLKLLELDRDKLKESNLRGGTLDDYIKLEKIKSTALRNSVLEKVGTPNFNYALGQAMKQDEWEMKKEEILRELSSISAKPIKDAEAKNKKYICYFGAYLTHEVPEEREGYSYYYTIAQSGSFINLYRDFTDNEMNVAARMEAERTRRAEERESRGEGYRKATILCAKLRRDFILNFKNEEKYKNEICTFAVAALIGDEEYAEEDVFEEVSSLYKLEETASAFYAAQEIIEKSKKRPLYAVLLCAYFKMECAAECGYGNPWDFTPQENVKLDELYEFLTSIGYEMSDEEKALQDGTSEVFANLD